MKLGQHGWYNVEKHLIRFYGEEHINAHLVQAPHCHPVRAEKDPWIKPPED